MNIREIGIKDRKAIRYLHIFANKDLNLVLSLKTRFRLNSKGVSKLTKLKRIYLPLGEIQYEMIYVPSGFFEMGSNDVVPSVK